MTPAEIRLVVEGYWGNLKNWDRLMAHYTAIQLSPHAGKKTPKPEKLLLFSKEEPSEKKDAPVVSIEEHRQARDALAASRQRVPWGS